MMMMTPAYNPSIPQTATDATLSSPARVGASASRVLQMSADQLHCMPSNPDAFKLNAAWCGITVPLKGDADQLLLANRQLNCSQLNAAWGNPHDVYC
jgi:hypothetical protein